MESGFVAKDDLVPFRCNSVSSCAKWRHRWVGVKGSTRNGRRDPKCPSARRLRIVREVTGPLVKMLHVPGWLLMKQLAVRVHFLRCGGLLGDLSDEGVVKMKISQIY
ncbi:hypothetical protein TNCV_936531 [Trichonephila clavipes]|nr:hypothetical protein TNCV_936531 [Trichonephila clavipes]